MHAPQHYSMLKETLSYHGCLRCMQWQQLEILALMQELYVCQQPCVFTAAPAAAAVDSNVPVGEAFRVADDVLRQGVRGISDIITVCSQSPLAPLHLTWWCSMPEMTLCTCLPVCVCVCHFIACIAGGGLAQAQSAAHQSWNVSVFMCKFVAVGQQHWWQQLPNRQYSPEAICKSLLHCSICKSNGLSATVPW